ncbi:sigma-70 family RNA polymerase sigma factor [Kerstersia similis]|uniref:sigma-70 family RNA polymerase sigma factor n=1 Tax=Kerstersia similis TaxID=206505 RepID=UPI0039F04203
MPVKAFTPADPVDALYQDHQGWLHGWLRRRLGNDADAADLVQDTFLSVICSGKAAEIIEPRPYLTTIARCLVANRHRRRQLEEAYLAALAALPEEMEMSPETRALALETLLRLDKMLDGLPAKVREAFMLVHLQGASYQEVAQALGVSTSSVKQYLMRANQQAFLVLLG